MGHMVTNFKKHIKLYLKLVKFAVSLDLEYRWSFVLMVFVELGFFIITIVNTRVVFWNINEIAGWNYNQVMVLLGVNMVFAELLLGMFFVHNLRNLPNLIRNGDLDLILTKPVSSQFIVSMRRPYFAMVPSIIAGIITIYYGFIGIDEHVGFLNIFNAIIILGFGLVIAYSIGMLISTLSIWIIGGTPLIRLSEQFTFMAKIPNSAFYGFWRVFFIIVMPIAFMASFPAQALMGDIKWWWFLLGFVLSVIFIQLSSLFWNFALKKYSSASS